MPSSLQALFNQTSRTINSADCQEELSSPSSSSSGSDSCDLVKDVLRLKEHLKKKRVLEREKKKLTKNIEKQAKKQKPPIIESESDKSVTESEEEPTHSPSRDACIVTSSEDESDDYSELRDSIQSLKTMKPLTTGVLAASTKQSEA